MSDKISCGTVIHDPLIEMPLAQRAHEMWSVHPVHLDALGYSREGFFLAHLEAAVRDSKPKESETIKPERSKKSRIKNVPLTDYEVQLNSAIIQGNQSEIDRLSILVDAERLAKGIAK